MTNEEILTKAIEKAKNNGWKAVNWDYMFFIRKAESTMSIDMAYFMAHGIIYSHNFAKAFFGDYEKQELPSNIKIGGNFINTGQVKINGLEKWQYHLQQMVISEDPIKYLEQYV